MRFYTLILSLFLLISFTNCSEKDDVDDMVSSGKVTLKVDGVKKEYNDVTASVLGDKIVIGANNADSDFGFIIDSNIEKGTYKETFGISYGINGDAVFSFGLNVTSCSFTITKHDTGKNALAGTFTLKYSDFNTQKIIDVTGDFNVTYTDMLSH